MRVRGHWKSVVFISLGAMVVAFAAALNVGWILLNWREVALLVFGIVFFVAIIAGATLNTVFLVREVRRNEQHDAFINAVTHELKTPIASIRLYLETLKARDVSEEQRREFYDVMLADSDRLLATVEQVLRAGQTGVRRRRIVEARVDLAELARECVELARTRYGLGIDAMRYAEAFAGGRRPVVVGDPDELRVAVSNLLDNAVKYSAGSVDVAVEVEAAGDRASVRVRDRGIGIPRGHAKRIFKRFYRVPAHVRARVKGTGLGLFIVRSIVERHGGRVAAESEGEGSGATFTITLPRVAGG
jgi:signal transduction histidine kinase